MATTEEVQELITAVEERVGMVLADEFQKMFKLWQEVMDLPAPPAPGDYISIPVVYVGTLPAGIASLGLFLKIPPTKITFEAVGGGSPGEAKFLAVKNFLIPGYPRISGYSSENCGPAPCTVYTIRAKQDAPVLPSEFLWEIVRMGTFGTLEDIPGTAELIVGEDGAIRRIEVKEIP